jgi:hypothetical protein
MVRKTAAVLPQASGCHAEMRSISSGKAKQSLRRSRQIKTAWMQF